MEAWNIHIFNFNGNYKLSILINYPRYCERDINSYLARYRGIGNCAGHRWHSLLSTASSFSISGFVRPSNSRELRLTSHLPWHRFPRRRDVGGPCLSSENFTGRELFPELDTPGRTHGALRADFPRCYERKTSARLSGERRARRNDE